MAAAVIIGEMTVASAVRAAAICGDPIVDVTEQDSSKSGANNMDITKHIRLLLYKYLSESCKKNNENNGVPILTIFVYFKLNPLFNVTKIEELSYMFFSFLLCY